MAAVTIELPEGIDGEEARFQLASALYQGRRITQGQAAELAGLSRATFIELLGKRSMPFTNITPDELQEEIASWPVLPSRTAPR